MKTILIVDDDLMVASIVRHVLERAGYRVIEAASGEEALEVWKRHSQDIDLLFTDLQMPGINGAELAEALEAEKPSLKIIFTSGSGGDFVAQLLADRTPCHFLPKPVANHDLLAAVNRVLYGP